MMDVDLIKRAITDGAEITITHQDDDQNFSVFPVRFSAEYLLCFDQRELMLDGYVVFPTEHVVSIERNAFNDSRTRMMRNDGALDGLRSPVDIDISSPFALFSSLQKLGVVVTLEVTDDRFPDDDPIFQIGPITDVDRDGFYLHWFSADGEWADNAGRFAFHEVREIGFLGNYESVCQRQLPPPPAAMKQRKSRDDSAARRRSR